MAQGRTQIGALTEFEHGTNVELVRAVGPREIEIRIFERGAGEQNLQERDRVRLRLRRSSANE